MNFRRYLLCLFVVLLSITAKADHISGGYFQYTCLGNNSYKIDLIIINDCNGVAPYSTATLAIRSGSNGYSASYTMPLISTELIAYCGLVTNCEAGLNKGYKKATYSYTLTLPYQSSDWEIFTLVDARNPSYIEDVKMYLSAGINNAGGNCFSSTRFTDDFVLFTCANSTTLFDVTFSNPSNLNVSTSTMCPQKDASGWMGYPGENVTYESGLGCNNPINTSGGFNYDPVAQQIEITPGLIGVSGFGLQVDYTDVSGNYAGYVMREYQIFSTVFCTNMPPQVSIPNGSTILNLNPHVQGCNTVRFTDVNELTLSSITGPPGMTYNVQDLGLIDDKYTYDVTICYTHPEDNCFDIYLPVVITFDDPGCLYDAIARKTYNIKINKQEFCPLNLYFTNRNTISGIAMPIYAKAEERIWVGDNMPFGYDPAGSGPEGSVTIADNTTLIAGTEIILPSCDSGLGDCVTLEGNVTLIISPNSCSSDCEPIPIDVTVKEIFKCGDEHLDAYSSGQGPFTYSWNILGVDYVSSSSYFNVHNIVSQQDNGQIPYTCTVYDAVGGVGVFEGQILGTKRFYEPILDNKEWIHYDPNSIIGPSGYYYAGNMGVFNDYPAFWWDSINTSPPWYGATHMWLTVWDRWGGNILNLEHDLELQPDGTGGEDWSMNNGEYYWNGKEQNGIWADCYEGDLTIRFNYVLKSRNCYNDESMDFVVNNIDEVSSVILFSCTDDDPWNPVETKSANSNDNYSESQKVKGSTRLPEVPVEENIDSEVSVNPNPAKDEFVITGDYDELNNVVLTDQYGNIVLSKEVYRKNEKINVSSFSSGLYTLQVNTPKETKVFKLVIL